VKMILIFKAASFPTTAAVEKVSNLIETELKEGFTNFSSESQDECETAAEIYQCGRDEAPTVTSSLHTQLKRDSTVVNKIFSQANFSVLQGINFSTIHRLPASAHPGENAA